MSLLFSFMRTVVRFSIRKSQMDWALEVRVGEFVDLMWIQTISVHLC